MRVKPQDRVTKQQRDGVPRSEEHQNPPDNRSTGLEKSPGQTRDPAIDTTQCERPTARPSSRHVAQRLPKRTRRITCPNPGRPRQTREGGGEREMETVAAREGATPRPPRARLTKTARGHWRTVGRATTAWVPEGGAAGLRRLRAREQLAELPGSSRFVPGRWRAGRYCTVLCCAVL